MTQERLTDIAKLSIERELNAKIDFDEVVKAFEGTDKDRQIVLS